MKIHITILTTLILLHSCSKPPQLQIDTTTFFEEQTYQSAFSRIRGSGDVSIALNGERYNGSMDMEWRSGGLFKADIYSPLGGVVISVRADSGAGTVRMDGKEYRFLNDETMDSLPFVWGKSITFGQFMSMLSGQLPGVFKIVQSKPDTIITERKFTRAIWEDSVSSVEVKIKPKEAESKRLYYHSKEYLQYWVMAFGKFHNTLARYIEFRVDDKNYFSIRYERIKPE